MVLFYSMLAVTIGFILVVPKLALDGFILYSALATAAYTVITVILYPVAAFAVINMLVTLLLWLIVFAGFTRRKWSRHDIQKFVR